MFYGRLSVRLKKIIIGNDMFVAVVPTGCLFQDLEVN
jgi:hypothetical protein